MRVLQVMASGERAGGAVHLRGLVEQLREDVEVQAAVGVEGPLAAWLEQLGVRVHRYEAMGSRIDPRGSIRLGTILRRVAVDVVHCHGTRAAFSCALIPRSRRPPMVYTAHGLSYRRESAVLVKRCFAWAERRVCAGSAAVISVSRRDLDDLCRRGWVDRARGYVIDNAVDERFRPGDGDAVRLSLGLGADAFVVGTVSRLVPPKSVADLVDAVAELRGATLVVVGDGPQRTDLQSRAARAGLQVLWLGERSDVDALLRALDVFCLASRFEGQPVALLEAMATGLPCVATATDGARDVLGEAGAGMLVPVGEPAALSAALRALQQHPEQRTLLGARARQQVAGRTHADVAREVLQVYRTVLRR